MCYTPNSLCMLMILSTIIISFFDGIWTCFFCLIIKWVLEVWNAQENCYFMGFSFLCLNIQIFKWESTLVYRLDNDFSLFIENIKLMDELREWPNYLFFFFSIYCFEMFHLISYTDNWDGEVIKGNERWTDWWEAV